MITIELIYNLSILVAISVISGFVDNRWKRSTLAGAIFQGILFGGAAIIGMFRPFVLSPGLFFDGRSVMLSLCAFFFGPVSAAVACLMTIPCRILQGGAGWRMGVLVILSSCIIGIVFRVRRKSGTADIPAWQLYLFGVAVHVAMLCMTVALPSGQVLSTLRRIALPCLGLYPLATILIGKILSDQEIGQQLIERLRQSREQLQTLIENIPGAVFRCTAHFPHRMKHVSRNVESLTGVAAEEFLAGRADWTKLIVPEDLPGTDRRIEESIAARQPYDVEYRVTGKNGEIRWVHERGRAEYSLSGVAEFLDGVVLDITDRKLAEEDRLRLEANLRHAQKMEAVGTLATGIAHDFNNLLTAISGYTELAKGDLPSDHPARESLDVVSTVVRDAGGIANALLTFSRKTTTGRSCVDLVKVVKDSLKLLRRILPAGVELRDSLKSSDPIHVLADVGQMHQVLMNLITNAKDAMPDGGVITVGLRETDGPAGGKGVAVTVEDNGCGMSPDVAARVFDPFFTTKPRGRGTGLGMAMVHGIIKEHEGQIDIQSETGKGTRITIRLAVCGPPQPSANGAEEALAEASRLGLKVLLAEDDAYVRAILLDTLRTAGYEVIPVGDGAEAMVRFKECPTAYCLGVLDIELPQMSGLDCCKEMQAAVPELPIILITGNPEFSIEGRRDERVVLLRKPFKMSELIHVTRMMLADRVPGTAAS